MKIKWIKPFLSIIYQIVMEMEINFNYEYSIFHAAFQHFPEYYPSKVNLTKYILNFNASTRVKNLKSSSDVNELGESKGGIITESRV